MAVPPAGKVHYLRRAIITIQYFRRHPRGIQVTSAPSSPQRLPAVGDEHAKATPIRYPAIPPANDANTMRRIFMYAEISHVIDMVRMKLQCPRGFEPTPQLVRI